MGDNARSAVSRCVAAPIFAFRNPGKQDMTAGDNPLILNLFHALCLRFEAFSIWRSPSNIFAMFIFIVFWYIAKCEGLYFLEGVCPDRASAFFVVADCTCRQAEKRGQFCLRQAGGLSQHSNSFGYAFHGYILNNMCIVCQVDFLLDKLNALCNTAFQHSNTPQTFPAIARAATPAEGAEPHRAGFRVGGYGPSGSKGSRIKNSSKARNPVPGG